MLTRADDYKHFDPDQSVSILPRLSAVPPPPSGGDQLYHLLDSLIALRLEFANDTEGQRTLVGNFGRTTLVKVRKILDTAIENTKVVIETADRPEPPNSSASQCALVEPRAAEKPLD